MNFENWNIDWEMIFKSSISAAVVIVVAIVVWIVIARALRLLERKARIHTGMLVPIRLVLRYVVIVVALLLCISAFGIPIGNFWTVVSAILGLVAIGFVAVWSVLSNISATFLLFIFKPFGVGNYIKLVGDDVNGEVIDVNFMFTTLRSKKGDLYSVPNNLFFQKTIMRPADPQAFEDQKDGENKVAEGNIDHSKQNLEGIKMPSAPSARPGR